MSLKEHLLFNRRMKELLGAPKPEGWLKKWLRKIWALIFLGSLLGCSAKKPLHAPPPPPVLNPPKTRALQKGDWILEHCESVKEGTCYCHRPRERLDAKGDKYKVIECR